MYKPRFLVTQEVFDAASAEEREKFNYVVVPDEPLPLPAHVCCFEHEWDSAENRTNPAH